METDLPLDADADTIRAALLSHHEGDALHCYSEAVFFEAKALLVKEKITGISILLIDEQGYVTRQVTGKKRQDLTSGEFSDRQLAVIKALEKVLHHCKQEGVRLIGYSDELVAYPAKYQDLEQASVYAMDIETSGVYAGADSILPAEDPS